jgi:hypothetical protein
MKKLVALGTQDEAKQNQKITKQKTKKMSN